MTESQARACLQVAISPDTLRAPDSVDADTDFIARPLQCVLPAPAPLGAAGCPSCCLQPAGSL